MKYERTRLPQAAFHAGNRVLSKSKSSGEGKPVLLRTQRVASRRNTDCIARDPDGAVGANVCILGGQLEVGGVGFVAEGEEGL